MAASGFIYVDRWIDEQGQEQRACTAQNDAESDGDWLTRHAAFASQAQTTLGIRGTAVRMKVCTDGLVSTHIAATGIVTYTPTVRTGGESDAALSSRHLGIVTTAIVSAGKQR